MTTNEMRRRSAFWLLVFSSLMPALTLAQSREQTLQTIAKLHGPERETRIREGARKEGNLIWYSSTTADDSLVLSQKFQGFFPSSKSSICAAQARRWSKNPSGISRGKL